MLEESSKELNQEGLEEHFRTFFRSQSKDFRASSIARLVEKKLGSAPGRILDIGCGSCVVTTHLLTKGYSVTSCDTSEAMIEMAAHTLSEASLPADNLHLMDITECQRRFPQSFDSIICLDVIEHIQDDNSALEQIYDILAPGGQLILSVPAHPFLYGPKDEQVGHYRRYSSPMLRERIERAGFMNTRIRYWNCVGFLSVVTAQKILRTSINESFRSSRRTKTQNLINSILRQWLQTIENHLPTPVGLTLVALAKKEHGGGKTDPSQTFANKE